MSYKAERRAILTRAIGLRIKDLSKTGSLMDKDGKPRQHKDVQRIKRAIQTDIAYLQQELEQMNLPGCALSYIPAMRVAAGETSFTVPASVPSVGKPGTKPVCLYPYHEAIDRWYQGRRLVGA